MAERRPDTLRADARLNRERILEVARDALGESADVSLNAIAKRAGVGAGTLYRHFANRDELVLAVYDHEVQRLVDGAPDLLAELAPLQALRVWFEQLAASVRVKHGLGDALDSATKERVVGETYGPVITAVTLMLQAGEADGTMRPGLSADDVLLLMGFLWRIEPVDGWQSRADRMLDLVIDGLRAAPGA